MYSSAILAKKVIFSDNSSNSSFNSSIECNSEQKDENIFNHSNTKSSNNSLKTIDNEAKLSESFKTADNNNNNHHKTEKEQQKAMTTIQQKRFRFMKRLSTHTGSFFSKSFPNSNSCSNDESTSEASKTPVTPATAVEKQQLDNNINAKEANSNEKSNRRHKFFTFANAQRLVKLASKKSFDSSSFETSITAPSTPSTINNHNNHDKILNETSRTSSTSGTSVYSIASFEVDIEKLTRELAMPTLDQQLTSFKKINSVDDSSKVVHTSSNDAHKKV